MITYDFSKRNGEPRYRYLYQCIRRDIRAGLLEANTKLPSKRALAQHLGVSISTVEQAYDLLVSEGYAWAKPGSGFFVSPNRNEGTYEQQLDSEAPEQQIELDFRANKASMSLFPVETWSRIMRRTLSERDEALFLPAPFNGIESLRASIASYLYEFRGIRTTPDNIIIGPGTEYLYARLLQILGRTTVMAMADPGYKKLAAISSAYGMLWEHIPVDEEGIKVSLFDSMNVDVAHVSPANVFPLGASMSPSRRQEILEWVKEKPQRYLIEDDYDSELCHDGRPQPPLMTQDVTDSVIYLNTFSKTLVPSIRIAYMVLPDRLMDLYRSRLGFVSNTVSSFEQIALAHFIDEGYFERQINRLRRHYSKQRERIVKLIEDSPLSVVAEIHKPSVGTHLQLYVKTVYSDEQVKKAARERGMNLAMLSDYCAHPAVKYAHIVIFNFASIAPEDLERAVDLLVDVFREDILRIQSRRNNRK